MRAVILCSAFAVGACDHDCTVEHLVDEYVGDATVVGCGDSPPEALLVLGPQIHDCVLAAYASRQPFIALWRTTGTQDEEHHAFAAIVRGGELAVTEFWQEDHRYREPEPTTMWLCSELVDDPMAHLGIRCVIAQTETCTP